MRFRHFNKIKYMKLLLVASIIFILSYRLSCNSREDSIIGKRSIRNPLYFQDRNPDKSTNLAAIYDDDGQKILRDIKQNSDGVFLSTNNDIKIVNVVTKQPDYLKEWMNCDSINKLLQKIQANASNPFREENSDGNRAVYFTFIINPEGRMIEVVVKQATKRNISAENEIYRYNSALKEIMNLRRLRELGWRSLPDIYGSCIKPRQITYVVSKINGEPFCQGNGLAMECGIGDEMKDVIKHKPDPGYSSLLWLSKVTCFFTQLEKHHIFMEDISGTNFYYVPETLDIFLVDADSLIFYGNIPLNSRSSCRMHTECSRPSGNLWRPTALNHLIYYSCQEISGYCINNTCRGYDSSLLTCGIGRWLILPLRKLIPTQVYTQYNEIAQCMMKEKPLQRCTMESVCNRSTALLYDFSNATKPKRSIDVLHRWAKG